MNRWVRQLGQWVRGIVADLYRDLLVFGGAGVVAWGLSGYDARWALLWSGLFCVWMGLGAPGIRRGG